MNKRLLLVSVLMLALGLGGGYWWARQDAPHNAAAQQGAPSAERKPLYYRAPMNPAVTSPVPAKDEMGMDYVPVYAEDATGGPAGTVRVDPATVQNMGVRTAKAERRVLDRTIRAVGRVTYDETRLARLNPKTEGWVKTVQAAATGAPVRRGQVLLSYYAPQLVAAQQEYLLALQNVAALKDSPYPEFQRNSQDLVAAARTRLELLDVPEHQIMELEQTREVTKNLHIHSPFDGVLLTIGAREGQYITPATELYQIADLSQVWVYADLYEDELPWVRLGDRAEMRVSGVPGRVFSGRVSYIYPMVDPKTRTVRLRLAFDNRTGALMPDMYTEVTLHTGKQTPAVAVPSEAVLRSGVRDQVYVLRAPGRYEPREVALGLSAEGWTEIRAGLKAGEEVVVSAQFLIDSESKLREAGAKMRDNSAASAPAVDDLDMSGMSLAPSNASGKTP